MSTTSAAPGAASSVVPEIPVPEAYIQALLLHQQKQLDAGFARKCLGVAVISTAAFLACLPVIGGLGYAVAHPPVRYFATWNGSVIEQHPTAEPAYSDADVIAYGEKEIRHAFKLDFKDFRAQISAQQDNFSKQGFISYYNALTHSNLFPYVRDKKMIMSADVTRTGMIRSQGRVNNSGPYIWEIQYPVTLSLDGQSQSLPAQNFIFILRVQRTDESLKPVGLEIDSLITHDAP